jgi:hypothetical protein
MILFLATGSMTGIGTGTQMTGGTGSGFSPKNYTDINYVCFFYNFDN